MKVAILGAGLSGLSCAITLEHHGINPVIFEKRSQVGDRFINAEIMLDALYRPVKDSVAYLAEKHNITLHPATNIRKLVLISEQKRAEIKGRIGFITIRGRHSQSLEVQLFRQVSAEILFNSSVTYEELAQEYTHVVIATGDGAYAAKIQDFRRSLCVTLRGATVSGSFDPYTVHAWLDYRLAPQGYCYVIPFSRKEANIVIAYPDPATTGSIESELLWGRFLERFSEEFGTDWKITDNFEITGYIIGFSPYPRIGNTLFTGNCLAAPMPFLGFGQFSSILSGIYAAHDISGNGIYDKLVSGIKSSFVNSLALRNRMNKMNNSQLDYFVSALSGPRGNFIFNSRVNLLGAAGFLLRMLGQ